MPSVLPGARIGIILSSGNQFVEPYFRAYGPQDLGIHVTRMRMGSRTRKAPAEIQAEIIQCAGLLADAKVDVIDLQGTGIMMALGPAGEAELVGAITDSTGIAAYTATQAVVEALRALAIESLILVNPMSDAAVATEAAYFEAVGFTIAHAVGLGYGEDACSVPPAEWVKLATAHDRPDGDGIFLSSSFTTMVDAVAPIEHALGKPAVTSIQAALWAGLRRLKPKLGEIPPTPALGRLFQAAGNAGGDISK